MKPILWQRALRASDLLWRAKYVGLVLSTFAGPDGTGAHPGEALLARETGLSRRTVTTAMGELRDAKFIEPDDAQPVDNGGMGRPAVAWKLRHPKGT